MHTGRAWLTSAALTTLPPPLVERMPAYQIRTLHTALETIVSYTNMHQHTICTKIQHNNPDINTHTHTHTLLNPLSFYVGPYVC